MANVTHQRNIMVPLTDRVHLATDLYLPGGSPGPWPAIVERTPYDKLGAELVLTAKYLAGHGYAVILQDVRGRYASEGEWYPFGNEGPDGVETVGWVRAQPWCDGHVATMGLSYSSCTQTSLAAMNPPGLSAQFVSQGFHNYHTASMRQGGALEVRFLFYAFSMARTSKEAYADPVARSSLERAWTDVRAWLKHAPPKAGLTPLRHVPSSERWLLDIWQHGEYDGYWRTRPAYSIEDLWDQHADVPIYLCGSWYDSYARSTVTNYVELSRRKKNPVRLIMGPWTHGDIDRSYAGDADFGPDAPLGYNYFLLRWFDAVLKGAPNGMLDGAPVQIFVMGGGSGRKLRGSGKLDVGGHWRDEREWPLARTRHTAYYLQPGGGLSPVAPPAGSTPTRYAFDPRDPVPTVGGNISAGFGVFVGGGFDQRGGPDADSPNARLPLSTRRDVLVFSTPPLEHAVEVTGTVVATLWASSSAPDTDFTVKLIDVYPPNDDYPDGYELNIGDSIIRARYRNSFEAPELMEPGRVYPFTITLYPTSVAFQPRHQIRVHISSSNFPRFDINPNTGGPLGLERVFHTAVQTIFHDADHPSHVLLPVIPS